jgi:uncharacterized protein
MTPGTTKTDLHSQVSATGTRVTLTFKSDSGRCYLYDDVTGHILPWSSDREATLKSFSEYSAESNPVPPDNVNGDAIRFVQHWAARYGAFFRKPLASQTIPSDSSLLSLIRASSGFLTLVLIHQCNLRCRYCAYSGNYSFSRTHAHLYMEESIVKQSIDWFVEFIRPQRERHPQKRFGLAFYGGEPLLNVPALRYALEYIADAYPELFLVALTTNGTLLTPKITSLLVQHNVHVSVSLDGPAPDHDVYAAYARSVNGYSAALYSTLQEGSLHRYRVPAARRLHRHCRPVYRTMQGSRLQISSGMQR